MAPTTMAQPPRPPKPSKVRYFKNKPLADARHSDSDSDSNEDDKPEFKPKVTQRTGIRDERIVAGGAGRIITAKDVRQRVGGTGVELNLGGITIGGAAKVKVEEESSSGEYETDEEEEEEEDVKPDIAAKAVSEESSEYETESEEEEVKKPVFRPVFVKKTERGITQEQLAAEAEEAARKEEEMAAQRKLDSKELAGETIRRELAEKEAGNELQPDVDDTDNLDPNAEFDAWRARELTRLLRDKQAQAALDAEKEEIERRRAMPEEQRLREDMEFADKTREKDKGQMGFLQKYYHKGAFHQEGDNLLNRDYTVATESAVDVSMLPKVMQVKNFGKASRTKYTHLADQDTSQGGWGNAARPIPGASAGLGDIGTTQTGCWNCGGPHQRKDCPNNNISMDPMSIVPGYQGGSGAGTSANASALGGGGGGWSGRETYREEGRDRRFDEERRRDHDRSAKERDWVRDSDKRQDDRVRRGGDDRDRREKDGDVRRRDDRDRRRGDDSGRRPDDRDRRDERDSGRRRDDRDRKDFEDGRRRDDRDQERERDRDRDRRR